MGQKLGGGVCALFLGVAGSTSNTMSPGLRPTYIPSGILMHPAVWPQWRCAENWGDSAPFWGRGAVSPSSTMWTGPRLPLCQVPSWSIQPFGHNRHGPKIALPCTKYGAFFAPVYVLIYILIVAVAGRPVMCFVVETNETNGARYKTATCTVQLSAVTTAPHCLVVF